ncbi:hypothetical protein NMY22_g17023 [Coprinellus aureogranulatus]|nr:hypothetical protein NMY22_g17023 [Coprinellus aureogranulatus]
MDRATISRLALSRRFPNTLPLTTPHKGTSRVLPQSGREFRETSPHHHPALRVYEAPIPSKTSAEITPNLQKTCLRHPICVLPPRALTSHVLPLRALTSHVLPLRALNTLTPPLLNTLALPLLTNLRPHLLLNLTPAKSAETAKGKSRSGGTIGNRGMEKKNPNAPSRLPEKWELLDQDQRKKLTDKAKRGWERLMDTHQPLPHEVRTWIRRAQPILPESASTNIVVAAHCMINSNGLTICPYHTTCDHTSRLSDPDVADNPDPLQFKVTGVPFPKRSDLLVPEGLKHLQPPKGWKKHLPNPHFTKERVYAFFPVTDSVRHLHCGCTLTQVLMDFYIWKNITMVSPAFDGIREPLHRPAQPRFRLYTLQALRMLNWSLTHVWRFTDDPPPQKWKPICDEERDIELAANFLGGRRSADDLWDWVYGDEEEEEDASMDDGSA